MRLLLVEDDVRLVDVLRRGLIEDGYMVDDCNDGRDVGDLAALHEYDGIVLDVMLPGKDGMDVCRDLRASGVLTPVLMLTARDTVEDAVEGLEAGADDYLRKPFAFKEFRARLQSILRRTAGNASPRLEVSDIVLDVLRREVRRGDKRIALTNREYQVLEYLMHNPGRTLTRFMIENHVWGYESTGYSNTVDVQIKRLRQKLDLPDNPSAIETVRGAGYRLNVDGR